MPRYNYLQNRLATSSFLLPVAACISIVLWCLGNVDLWLHGSTLAIAILSVYLIMELNNGFVLLRIRSRSTSSVLCLLLGYSQFIHGDREGLVTMLLLLLAYHLLFRAYQDRLAMAKVFGCFLCLGICCLMTPVLIAWTLPIFLGFIVFQAMNLRCFCAMLVGLTLPALFLATYAFLMDQEVLWLEKIAAIEIWDISYYSHITPIQWADLAFLVIILLVAIVHYVRTSYKDKIKTRSYLSFLSWMCVWLIGLLLCQPQHFNTLYLALCVTASPLISHLWALSSGKWSNRLFCLTLVLVTTLTILNLWTF